MSKAPDDTAPDAKAPGNKVAETKAPNKAQEFDRRMLEALVCPRTGATLRYDAERQELISDKASLAFPIRNGIPIMLVDEARTLE